MAAAADSLNAHRLLNGQISTLKDLRATREDKIGVVLDGVRRAVNSVVLLLDEPALGYRRMDERFLSDRATVCCAGLP